MVEANAPLPFDELRKRKSTLEQRLEDGYRRIGAAELEGRDVRVWEDFWLSLLGEYEAVCDEILEAA